MANHEGAAGSVESFDALSQAYDDAQARIAAMAPKIGKTLIDTISAADWAAWDASGEKALVADSVEIDALDHIDDDQPQVGGVVYTTIHFVIKLW